MFLLAKRPPAGMSEEKRLFSQAIWRLETSGVDFNLN